MESDCLITQAGEAIRNDPSTIMPRWAALVGEYEALRDALQDHTRQPHWPGVAPYIAMLKTEASLAEKAIKQERLDAEATSDAGGSNNKDSSKISFAMSQAFTNIAARETMWRIVKTSPGGILALDRKFPKSAVKAAAVELSETSLRKGRRYRRWGSVGGMNANGSRSDGVFVNAVVDDGFEWLRVLTLTTQQLLVTMAENGWEWGEDSDDDLDEDGIHSGDESTESYGVNKATARALSKLEDIADIPLVETILDLVDVARENRSRGAYPHICVVLTRIDDESSVKGASEVARFLRVLRDGLTALASTFDHDIDGNYLRATVHTSRSKRAVAQCPSDLSTALQSLMPDISNRLTPTLNIDTSILIALASDISHKPVEIRSWFPHQRVDEITHERKKPGQMLQSLCDVMRGHKLVCTREAASAFRAMVRDMGQVSEKKRAALLVWGCDGEIGVATDKEPGPRDALVAQFRALTLHPTYVPDDLMLPITVIDEAWNTEHIKHVTANLSACRSKMPAIACNVAQEMNASPPTLSVFFYGWSLGHTTITTNSTARNKITRLLEKHRTSSREANPHVWLSRPVRSLNGTNPRGPDE